MQMINANTFIANEEQDGHYSIDGTVEVTINKITKRVRASKWKNAKGEYDQLIAYTIAGRYETGTKVWHCHITQYNDGRESIGGGFENRATRSRIRYIVGFMEAINKDHHSKR